jgi:hypothetical protein
MNENNRFHMSSTEHPLYRYEEVAFSESETDEQEDKSSSFFRPDAFQVS